MAVRIKKNSHLRFSDLVVIDGYEFWDTAILPDEKILARREGDINYQLKVDDHIDTLAYTYYGDPVRWWVIAVANKMEDIPTALVPGLVIRIPDPNYVKTKLFAVSTRSS